MGIDWGFAGQVGGVGFGMVFGLLIILAIVIWLTGMVINQKSTGNAGNNENDKSEKGK